ncbi:MAG: haloalkane dehalogenase [Nitrospiraceae bacterium]|nr:haloalkane dehalogenase [Nitrospiraceae bacterium]
MDSNRDETPVPRPSAAFSFEYKHTHVGRHRIHYIEEGSGKPVLFIHGNPTSSYLWRNILPEVARATGGRAIALDLLGFGASDKPSDVDYSLDLHATIVEGFIEELGLEDVVLVLHDWGGPLGMRYAGGHAKNVRGVVLMETFLWDTSWKDFGSFAPAFRLLRTPAGRFLNRTMNLFVNVILPGSVAERDHLTPEIMQRYRAPFPTLRSRKAMAVFPALIPIAGRPEASRRFFDELDKTLKALVCPVMWIKADPGAIITSNTEYRLIALSARLPQLTIRRFGRSLHYLQEDNPGRVAGMIVEWMRENGLVASTSRPPDLRKAA